MKDKKFFNLSMFVLRATLGVILMLHGSQKLFGMFGGIGLGGTAKLLEGLSLPYPHFLATLWAYIEFIGGAFLLLGILARWAAMISAVTVLFYLWSFNLHYGFFVQAGGMEYSLLLIASMVPIMLMGGGTWSVWDV